MDRNDIASLAFKITGIYVIVQAIELVPTTMSSQVLSAIKTEGVHWSDVLVVGVPLLIACTALGILAFFLIAWSRRFAARALGEPRQGQIDFRGEAHELQAAAFSIIGVVLIANAVPQAVFLAEGALHSADLRAYAKEFAPNLIVIFLEISAGYWLLFMPRLTVRLWERIAR